MRVVDLPLAQLREAPWNPNTMTPEMQAKLRASLTRFDVVENLVVRPLRKGTYEVLSGNQRLSVLKELQKKTAPCCVVELGDAEARLLVQALNRIQGEDDLGLKAELVRAILEKLPQDEVLALLPETAESLGALASLGQESMAEHLQAWQKAQEARLRHFQVQLTSDQMAVVEQALAQALPAAKKAKGDNPNVRGVALFLVCKAYLSRGGV